VEASVDRVIAEPGITATKRDTLLSMLASSHALMLAIAGLDAGMPHREEQTTPPPALQTFAHDVDFTLYFLAAALRGSKVAGDNLPQLREDHRKLVEARGSFAQDDDFILAETDRVTVSLNTLREQVMRYVASEICQKAGRVVRRSRAREERGRIRR
jgi:GTPase Era involved in 16S rRNA processing